MGSEILFVDENMLRAVNFESGVRDIADVPIDLTPISAFRAGHHAERQLCRRRIRRQWSVKIERSEEAKTVLAISYSGDLTNAILKFQNAHDNVNVRLVYDTDNALDNPSTKSAQWDILILNSHYDAQILRPILNRGWALPIQSESVRAFVACCPLFPCCSMQNGEVLGVPLDVDCYSAGVNVGGPTPMNLSIEDSGDRGGFARIHSIADSGRRLFRSWTGRTVRTICARICCRRFWRVMIWKFSRARNRAMIRRSCARRWRR